MHDCRVAVSGANGVGRGPTEGLAGMYWYVLSRVLVLTGKLVQRLDVSVTDFSNSDCSFPFEPIGECLVSLEAESPAFCIKLIFDSSKKIYTAGLILLLGI